MKLGRFMEAVEDYTRVLEHSPDAEIYQHRGWAQFFADAWKLARRDFDRAIELSSAAADAYVGRGLSRVMLGHYREAVADAESALRLKPSGPAMMLNIACIYAQAIARVANNAEKADPQVLTNSYHEHSVAAIRQTLRMLRAEERRSFWLEKIFPDPALAPIREKGLKQLQQEFFPSKTNGESPALVSRRLRKLGTDLGGYLP
jgi:tetratricopeptide (TPR) repeat protein